MISGLCIAKGGESGDGAGRPRQGHPESVVTANYNILLRILSLLTHAAWI